MSEEERKLLEEMKENCLKQSAIKKYNLLRHIEDLELERKKAILLIKGICFDNEQYCVDLKEDNVRNLLNILEERV